MRQLKSFFVMFALALLLVGCNNSNKSTLESQASGESLASDESKESSKETTKAQEPKKKTFSVNGVKFTMVEVEGGTFIMGATGDNCDDDEYPTHEVTLDSYYIGQTEVTQELWVAVMGSNPSYFNGYGNTDYDSSHSEDYGTNLQRPVEYISWEDCQVFISKLNEKTGMKFRLPTEAEWEFAARGGNLSHNYKYSGSNNIEDVAWYKGNSGEKTHDVATKQANELGIYDMSGNVAEWCNDWYGEKYYSSSPSKNPQGPSTGTDHVIRCGSWVYETKYCQVFTRHFWDDAQDCFGLRLAL